MKNWSLILLVLGVACAPSNENRFEGKLFGATPTITESIPVAKLLDQPLDYHGREVLVTGAINRLCEHRGCWISMLVDEKEVLVRFKDEAFFVPREVTGKQATVQGVFHAEPLEHKGHAHEEGALCQETAGMRYTMIATGCVIKM